MYFITKKTSATGEKFNEILIEGERIYKLQVKLSEEYGFTKWRNGNYCVYGGISSLIFETEPDQNIFKKNKNILNEWVPRKNTKLGKEFIKKVESIGRITPDTLNMCIGYDKGAPFRTIGFYSSNEDYFGIVVGDNWGVEMPEDCEEVTYGKYKEMFNID